MAAFGENLATMGTDHRTRLIDDDEDRVPTNARFENIRSHIMDHLQRAYEERAAKYNARARSREYARLRMNILIS